MTAVSFDPAVFDTPEYWRDPYPHLKVLRDHFPVYHDELHGLWYITRYDDVCNAFRDNVHYSSRNLERSMALVFGTTMMQFDGEEHTKRRNIVAPEFSGRRMEPLIPIIEKNTQDLVDRITAQAAERLAQGFAEKGEVELIDAFSSRLPVMVIIDMLGLPQEDHDRFHEWYPAMMAGLTGTPDQRAYGIECNAQFHAYIDRLVDERSVKPGEDLISKLCTAEVDGARMSKEDIKAFSSLLLVAGGETTDKAIGNMWVHMMENPEQFAEVKRDPELFDRVFTETMRITPPAGSQQRDVIEPVELHGRTIPVGAEAHFSIFAANHDERVFDHPDDFDIFRDDLYFGRELRSGYFEGGRAGHLGFGLGKHFCVGYQLARSEAVIGSQALLRAMGNPRVKAGGAAHIQVAGPMNEQPRLDLEFDVV